MGKYDYLCGPIPHRQMGKYDYLCGPIRHMHVRRESYFPGDKTPTDIADSSMLTAEYIANLVDSKMKAYSAEILELALQKAKEDAALSIAAAITAAIEDITVVYGGSASDVMEGVEEV